MASTLASRIAQALTSNAGRKAQHDLYNEFYAMPPAARIACRNELLAKLPQDLVKSIQGEFSRPSINPTMHILIAVSLGIATGTLWLNSHKANVKATEEYYQNLNK